jgi:hypothetical protein
MQLLNDLEMRGMKEKKIKKDKIKDLIADPDKVDADTIFEFYQGIQRADREQIEENKKKKLKEVELWQRALREEEKIAIEKYATESGDKEIEQIQASIKERETKE